MRLSLNSGQAISPKPLVQPAVRFGAAPDVSTWEPVPAEQLWSGPLDKVTFKQNPRINDCYLLAALDGLFHHPQGATALERINVERKNRKLRVMFPSGANSKFFRAELNQAASSNSTGLKVLEHAYITSMYKDNDTTLINFNSPERAVRAMFGDTVEEISFDRDSRTVVEGGAFYQQESDERFKAVTQDYLVHAGRKPDGIHIPFATLLHPVNSGDTSLRMNHIYSVRLDETTPEKVSIGDPFDTNLKLRVNMQDFVEHFALSSARIPADTLDAATYPLQRFPSNASESSQASGMYDGPIFWTPLTQQIRHAEIKHAQKRALERALQAEKNKPKPPPPLPFLQRVKHHLKTQAQESLKHIKEAFTPNQTVTAPAPKGSYTQRRTRSSMIFGN